MARRTGAVPMVAATATVPPNSLRRVIFNIAL
ncbi:hypothetical protein L286_00980 [Sphingobium sp. HDIP04]|nr:hypothetical protein L286_00980 [Sphingobium sp. HDIP04]